MAECAKPDPISRSLANSHDCNPVLSTAIHIDN